MYFFLIYRRNNTYQADYMISIYMYYCWFILWDCISQSNIASKENSEKSISSKTYQW